MNQHLLKPKSILNANDKSGMQVWGWQWLVTSFWPGSPWGARNVWDYLEPKSGCWEKKEANGRGRSQIRTRVDKQSDLCWERKHFRTMFLEETWGMLTRWRWKKSPVLRGSNTYLGSWHFEQFNTLQWAHQISQPHLTSNAFSSEIQLASHQINKAQQKANLGVPERDSIFITA